MIGTPCSHCGGTLKPYTSTREGWKCPASKQHADLHDAPGDCPQCHEQGVETALKKATIETHGYICEQCGKSPLEAVKKPKWLSIDFEAQKPGLGSAFIPKHAQDYAAFLESKANSIPPCECDPRWGLMRIGYAGEPRVVHVDGCCDFTIEQLRELAEM